MKERPILFNGPMVRAIIEGRKTQTRRVVKLTDEGHFICARHRRYVTACDMKDGVGPWWHPHGGHPGEPLPQSRIEAACPFGQVGDRLWVRETLYFQPEHENHYYSADRAGVGAEIHARLRPLSVKRADRKRSKWISEIVTPSIHMPRWASRITLEITGVRVERLQEISDLDCYAEGISDEAFDRAEHFKIGGSPLQGGTPERCAFAGLWDSLAKSGTDWESNPWVWVVEFKNVSAGAHNG